MIVEKQHLVSSELKVCIGLFYAWIDEEVNNSVLAFGLIPPPWIGGQLSWSSPVFLAYCFH